MGFKPGIMIGDELTNSELRVLFQCGNMGGMRRSRKTGCLVIISDYTKGLYRDEWKNGVLHYTGMGKNGDQVLDGNQNRTLYDSNTNGVEIHLFEVLEKAIYTYRGVVKLVEKPYHAPQLDAGVCMRSVWVFPVKPVINVTDCMSDDFEKKVVSLSNRELNKRAKTNRDNKEPRTTETTVYYRDPYLKELVKRIADGKCQYCGSDAPFKDKNNEPYLEEHHVKKLADGGSDTIDNVVAICPNCHRKVHVLDDELIRIELEDIAKQNVNRWNRLLAYEQKIKSTVLDPS